MILTLEDITIGQIGLALTYIVGLIGSIAFLYTKIRTWIKDAFKEDFKTLRDDIREVDVNACKNYLVSFLSDVEKDKNLDEIEKERFWEQYEHYQKIGGNSYIKRKVEQLQKENKL